MCGICGFTGATNSAEDRATLQAMCDVMAHRGPDGEGLYLTDGVALGHRRLALIDLQGGAQPMTRTIHDTTWTIVFNGEIYNYRDLRVQLEEEGFAFTTESDTEVLLVGYVAWGSDVLQRVRGMFAFAIYNETTHELFCARDFFGIKPFYYTQLSCGFAFASEIKCLLEHPGYQRQLNEDALAQYLCFQFSALHETFFKGIYKLMPGHCLTVHADGTMQVIRYWQPEFNPCEDASFDDVVKQIEETMRESVRYHNVADVEVGSFLSSGIDSSYLAALLAQENPDIKTFTVGFAEYEGERDEVSWARELAQTLQVQNDAHHVSEDEFWEALPLVQWHMDEPSADPSAVALYFVDKLAAQRVKAVLSGEGADEFFGGYRIYQAPLASAHLAKAPHALLSAGAKTLHALHLRGANYLERASERVEDWYYTNANGVAFTAEERQHILSDELRTRLNGKMHTYSAQSAIGLNNAEESCELGARDVQQGMFTPQQLTAPVYAEVPKLDDSTRMQYLDLWFWLVGDILLKTDKMAMAHSLESRVPFLDREVFACAARVPTALKIDEHQTKIALRAAAQRAIPQDWAQKQKLGFPVPLVNWLRQDEYYQQVKDMFAGEYAARFFNQEELLRLLDEHRAGTADNSRRIWIIYSFLVWYRVYFTNELDAQVQAGRQRQAEVHRNA